MARIDWNQVREEWNHTPDTPFADFCASRGLPLKTALRYYRKWVREAHAELTDVAAHDLTDDIRQSQRTDSEAADGIMSRVRTALDTIDPTDLKNLKELSGILNQISSTRKNIINYLPENPRGKDGDWTRSLTIVSDQDDAL